MVIGAVSIAINRVFFIADAIAFGISPIIRPVVANKILFRAIAVVALICS